MATIALSKSSLQQQRDRLRLFERFLPSLELKRQQLTAEYKKAMQVLAEAEQGADQASRSLPALAPHSRQLVDEAVRPGTHPPRGCR